MRGVVLSACGGWLITSLWGGLYLYFSVFYFLRLSFKVEGVGFRVCWGVCMYL